MKIKEWTKKSMKFGKGLVKYLAYFVESMHKQFQECISCRDRTIKL
jgi:hypothetical protein